MHSTKVPKVITWITSFFYLVGVWHNGDKPTVKDMRIKLFYSVLYTLFPLSLIVGAIGNENVGQSVFLTEVSIGVIVLSIKLMFLIWKQNGINDLLHRVCVFDIQDNEDYARFNSKIKVFAKVAVIFLTAIVFGAVLLAVVIPFIGSGRTLFLEIGFPLDWRNSEVAFWIAAIFICTQCFMSVVVTSFSVIIWYLLFVCSLRYDVLGSEIKHMGQTNGIKAKKQEENHVNYRDDLHMSIDTHLYLTELTTELGSYFSGIFFVQFGTSGLCICGSIYCLAFNIGDNTLERFMYLVILLYFIAEIFMITYFGNEIMLSYNRLSYSLFESDWVEQPQSTKKCIIVFGEYLKQPLMLIIGKLYPLTLATFTRILNSAYSMFNILKSFQH